MEGGESESDSDWEEADSSDEEDININSSKALTEEEGYDETEEEYLRRFNAYR